MAGMLNPLFVSPSEGLEKSLSDPNDVLLRGGLAPRQDPIYQGLFDLLSPPTAAFPLARGLLPDGPFKSVETDPAWHIFEDQAGGFRFNFKAGNHEKMASSESYTRREDAVRAVERFRELSVSAPILFD